VWLVAEKNKSWGDKKTKEKKKKAGKKKLCVWLIREEKK
jgi:hypothetical protein